MPILTGLQVLHPHGVSISRDASESFGKTKRAGDNRRTLAAKVKALEEYTEANWSVKRSMRADKRNYL
ncbi:hypothetical protein DPMN_087371 [Dreissena polymorpha]|uniref:Uncharacterized protein n=1 Tax=Dreissena polymorpha TaxID=45954 RepID=A0A9D4QWU2_DREPO|nr:hypothetical protein DPMN_087371 [Dreissena polymorpha]